MTISVEIPDALTDSMEAFRLTQIGDDGNYKYADLEDMMQQNANDGILGHFAQQIQDAAIAAQFSAIQASVAVAMPARKTPISAASAGTATTTTTTTTVKTS